jgi:hypothetical protein
MCVWGAALRVPQASSVVPDNPRTGLALRLPLSGSHVLSTLAMLPPGTIMAWLGEAALMELGGEVRCPVALVGMGRKGMGDGRFGKETVRWGRQLRSCHLDASAPACQQCIRGRDSTSSSEIWSLGQCPVRTVQYSIAGSIVAAIRIFAPPPPTPKLAFSWRRARATAFTWIRFSSRLCALRSEPEMVFCGQLFATEIFLN